MLNRKGKKALGGPKSHHRSHERKVAHKEHPARRRFIISSKSSSRSRPQTDISRHGHARPATPSKPAAPATTTGTFTTQSAIDLTEIIKTLLHLAQENGYVTYDQAHPARGRRGRPPRDPG
jgi:hypothetical protein